MTRTKLKEQENRILSYVTGLLFYYGVMDGESLYRMVRETLEVDHGQDTFRLILERGIFNADSPYDLDADEDYYHHLDVDDVGWVLEEQGAREFLPYRPVSEKEARQVMEGQYLSLWDPAVKELFLFLQEKYGWSEVRAREMIAQSQERLRNGVAPTKVANDFLSKIDFQGLEELQPFMNMLTEMGNHTPLWILKGWTPREVFEKYEKDALQPLPDAPLAMKEEEGKEGKKGKEGKAAEEKVRPVSKVGRNAPCLCGSGKKYKKCCGAPVSEEKGGKIYSMPLAQGDVKDAAQASAGREPTREEWSALYEAADTFKKSKCWEWMYNDDIFGVMDPETGEIAYPCIMGNWGEYYGLAAYQGKEGLATFLNMLAKPEEVDPMELFINQKCLMASFEDRNELADEDRAVIKDLGLKFKGRKQWPLFRSYETGFYPWSISAWECRFLTLVLQQTLEVARRCREDKSVLEHKEPYTFLVRVPKEQGDQLTWDDRYLGNPPPAVEYASFEITDELLLRKILTTKKTGSRQKQEQGVWEADTFWLPFPVQEQKNERPYYPRVFLIVEQSAGLIIRHELMRNLQEEGYRCVDAVTQLLAKENMVPSSILVERDETYYLLAKACRQLEIPLEKFRHLQMIPKIREKMMSGKLP